MPYDKGRSQQISRYSRESRDHRGSPEIMGSHYKVGCSFINVKADQDYLLEAESKQSECAKLDVTGFMGPFLPRMSERYWGRDGKP